MTEAARGPCERCEHARTGNSVARLTLDAMPDRDRSAVRDTHTRRSAQEESSAGHFADERESNRTHGTTMYSGRPTAAGFPFCGVYEFSNTYTCCETKNHDLDCAQFTEQRYDAVVHDCSTCVHQQRVSPRVDLVLRQFLYAYEVGRQLLEKSVEPGRTAAAEQEYTDCVDGAGFVATRPAFLPWCAALSTTDQPESTNRYLVGPVVNSARRCTAWAPRTELEFTDVEAHLDALTARPRRIYHLLADLEGRRDRLRSLGAPDSVGRDTVGQGTGGQGTVGQDPRYQDSGDRAALDPDYLARLRQAETNAQADLIAFCLRQRGSTSAYVTAVCNTWVPNGWTPDAPFDDTYRLLDDTVTGAPVAATFIGAVPIAARPGPAPAAPTTEPVVAADPVVVTDRGGTGPGGTGPGDAAAEPAVGQPVVDPVVVRADPSPPAPPPPPLPQPPLPQPPLPQPPLLQPPLLQPPLPQPAPSEPAPPQLLPPQPALPQPAQLQAPVPFPVVPLVSYRHPTAVGTGLMVVADAVQTLLVYADPGSLVAVDLRTFPYATWTQLQTSSGPQPVSLFVQLPVAVNAVWLDPTPSP